MHPFLLFLAIHHIWILEAKPLKAKEGIIKENYPQIQSFLEALLSIYSAKRVEKQKQTNKQKTQSKKQTKKNGGGVQ